MNHSDRVLVSKRHASSVSSVRWAKGPNCDADHFMVRAVVTEQISVLESRAGKKESTRCGILMVFKDAQRKLVYERRLEEEEREWTTNSSIRNDAVEGSVVKLADEVIGEKEMKRNGEMKSGGKQCTLRTWRDNWCKD